MNVPKPLLHQRGAMLINDATQEDQTQLLTRQMPYEVLTQSGPTCCNNSKTPGLFSIHNPFHPVPLETIPLFQF